MSLNNVLIGLPVSGFPFADRITADSNELEATELLNPIEPVSGARHTFPINSSY